MEQCIICFEDYTPNNMYIILSCNHKLCLICYEKILNTTNNVLCPICRNIIEKEITINIPQVMIIPINERDTGFPKCILIIFCIIIILTLILFMIIKHI